MIVAVARRKLANKWRPRRHRSRSAYDPLHISLHVSWLIVATATSRASLWAEREEAAITLVTLNLPSVILRIQKNVRANNGYANGHSDGYEEDQ